MTMNSGQNIQAYPSHSNTLSPAHAMQEDRSMVQESNQLLALANPLITLITQLRYSVEQANVAALRARIMEEIQLLEKRLRDITDPKPFEAHIILATRYCLCTAIDEAVLTRPWGVQSVWAQESLLSYFHRETSGGERFYIILEEMMKDLRRNIDFLELCYVLLSLGFEGMFHGDENLAYREEFRARIFYKIRTARPKPDRTLSTHWRLFHIPVNDRVRIRRIKKYTFFTLILLILMGIYFNVEVNNIAAPIMQKLNDVATAPPITTFSDVIQRSLVIRPTLNN